LEAVAEHQPVGVSDLSRIIGIDKSAAHRLAVTLQAAGWLDKAVTGRWRVAPNLMQLTRRAAETSLVASVRPVLEQLRDYTGETVILVAVDHDRLLVMDLAESRFALRISPPRPYLPLPNSSAARAVAAYLPPDDVAALRSIDPSLDDQTLALVRRNGYALNDREITRDTYVVGAAVRRADGQPIAAIIIAAPSSRVDLQGIRRIGDHLAQTVTTITTSN
jgi:IclR family acetate operon transcriptional repressor